jgi:DNA repair protein RadA/Sms
MVEEVADRRCLSSKVSCGEEALPLNQVSPKQSQAYSTEIGELDRVLGSGGIVPGAVILVGGEPGIGKSTLLLQVSHHVSSAVGIVLLVAGEESAHQVKMRADRLGVSSDRLYILSETNLQPILDQVETMNPVLLVVDSIQSLHHPDIPAAPGSVSQVRECASSIIELAKRMNVSAFISGHVTKEGAIAGPRVLEHMVDTVLYFEGERFQSFRIIRAVKNRFGATQEIGIFEMRANGLFEIANPSGLFIRERVEETPGSVVVAVMEGTRPLLVELQALVAPSCLAVPRRLASGVDYNRLSLILAVLERRIGTLFEKSDVYVSLTGGIKVTETASDLGVALAVVSAHRNRAIPSDLVAFGEIGLGGEVRFVAQVERRLKEAHKLGFRRGLVPSGGDKIRVPGMEVTQVRNLEEALVYN